MARKTHCLGALRIGTAFAALTATAPLVAQVADAPPVEAAEISDVDEGNAIVVTARRREENLLDVHIPVTAYSGEQLEIPGAPDIPATSHTTPNLTHKTPP